MNKIPTVFVRDPENRKYVLPEVTTGCEWVLDGDGTATRKYDGTCVLVSDEGVFARREVKPGKSAPAGFVPLGTDETTGKTVGWEPAKQSGFGKYIAEALSDGPDVNGTYELVGPKINGNPEGYQRHTLVLHAGAEIIKDAPRDFDALREWMLDTKFEGIVWHHPDGRMAKLKRRDFA